MYKDEVIKKHGEGFEWENKPIGGQVAYTNGGKKAYGRWDAIYCFNFVNA
jgi:hypothetical protein